MRIPARCRRQFRQDALIATAKLIAFIDERWQQLINAGNDDLVFTCGIFQTDSAEHAMTKVPGQVTFTLNIGGTKNEVMEDLHNSIAARAGEIASETWGQVRIWKARRYAGGRS